MTNAKRSVRHVHIHGVTQPVTVEITQEGLAFHIKGTKKRLSLSWYRAAEMSQTPADVPSFLMGKPLETLQYLASKVSKREAERAAKKGAAA